MKKTIISIIFLLGSLLAVSAQDYNWAVGVRAGGHMSGISLKHKLNASNAIEGIMAIPYKDGFVFTGLYQRTMPVIDEGFSFYYGAGAHIGGWKHKFSLGADGIIGLEYKIPQIPMALSLDYKPVFNIVERTRFYLLDFGFSVKVTF